MSDKITFKYFYLYYNFLFSDKRDIFKTYFHEGDFYAIRFVVTSQNILLHIIIILIYIDIYLISIFLIIRIKTDFFFQLNSKP